jgi:hypothetical protein
VSFIGTCIHPSTRTRALALMVLFMAAACGRAPEATARLVEGRMADGDVSSDARPAPQRDAAPAEAAPEARGPVPGKIAGRVVPLGEAPRARVIVLRAGETKAVWSATADRDGRFVTPDLAPGTYRIVLPGDGLHSTADLYATVAGDGDAGRDEVVIHRSKGCPIVVSVTGPGGAVAAAALELELPDLEQVGDERARIRATTGDDGIAEIAGTCVRGPVVARITPPGAAGPFEVRRGTIGNGRDRLVISLPGADAGPSDGGARGEESP